MIRLKLCGLTRLEDIEAVNQIRPDYVGFVFAKSKRQIDEQRAMELKSTLRQDIQAVGVFVNEELERIVSLAHRGIVDLIQLHGDEDNIYISKLKKALPEYPVIKAIRVKKTEDILKSQKLSCDYLLLDTFLPNAYGGGGKAFDWSLIPGDIKPFFLAGGLHAGNVTQAIVRCSPRCLDLSSGIETDGKKDPKKMQEIADIVRQLNSFH